MNFKGESVWIELLSAALVKCLLWASSSKQAGDKLPASCAFFPTWTPFSSFSAHRVPRGGVWRSPGFVSEDWWIPQSQTFLYQLPSHLGSARQGKDNASQADNNKMPQAEICRVKCTVFAKKERRGNGADSKTAWGRESLVSRKLLAHRYPLQIFLPIAIFPQATWQVKRQAFICIENPEICMHSPGAECPTVGESSWGGLSPPSPRSPPALKCMACSGHKLQKEKGRSYYPKLETLGHISSPPKKCCAYLPPALQPPVVLWRVSNPAHVLYVDLRASCPAIPLHSKKKKKKSFALKNIKLRD